MTNIAKQFNEWDIETIEKRLIEIQAAADGDCHFSHFNGIEILALTQRAVKLAVLKEKENTFVKVNDIVQITNTEHDWYSCLVVVDQLKNFGCRGYIDVPQQGRAYIRLEHTDYKIVGKSQNLGADYATG